MNTVPVAEIKHMAVHDGPGMRTTVFLKGCPLHCIWCHNPECISAAPELLFRAARCTACRRCEAVCPHRAHRFTLNGHEFRRGLCDGCGACAEVCPAGALTLCGRSAAAGELYDELMEDADFYRISGGGVTLSGGEPLLYPAFCRELFAVLGRAGIHRALDTSAAVPWEAFETVLPETDLLLVDFKHPDSGRHRELTGQDNRLIRENLRRLQAAGVPIEIRIPLVPGCTDAPEELEAAAGFLAELPCVVRVKLLAYHSFARSKYEAVGRPDTMPEVPSPDGDEMEAAAARLRARGLAVLL